METGSDDGNDTRTSKKRKYEDAVDDSSEVGEGSDLAQAGPDEETSV